MADVLTLQASTDRVVGSRPSRRLRKEGKIPGVVYGAGDEPTSIALEWTELRAALTTAAGLNALITLQFDGDERVTILKDMQRHPVKRDITHVDFVVIDRTQPLEVEIPVNLVNTEGDHLKELVVDQQLFTLPVLSLPMVIPNEFEIDCTNLTLDEPIRAGSIDLPEGVELNIDPEEAIVTADVPVVDIPEPEEDEELEEGEEGEGAEGEAAEGDEEGPTRDSAGEDGDDGGDDDS